MLHLLLLFCQQQVVWPMRRQCSTRGLPPAWPPNGINPIAQQCPGYDADLHVPSPSFSQCIRGTHSSYGHAAKSQTPPMDLVISEADFI